MAARSKRPVLGVEEKAREVAAHAPKDLEALSPEEVRLMLHELRVHQIELEMQNEELRRTQLELNASQSRYFDLYDLAPVAYCTLSEKGLILQANLAAGAMLGQARSALVKQLFTKFILKEDQDAYYFHRKHLAESGAPQSCEVRLVKSDGSKFWTHLAMTAAQDGAGESLFRLVIMRCDRKKASEGAG